MKSILMQHSCSSPFLLVTAFTHKKIKGRIALDYPPRYAHFLGKIESTVYVDQLTSDIFTGRSCKPHNRPGQVFPVAIAMQGNLLEFLLLHLVEGNSKSLCIGFNKSPVHLGGCEPRTEGVYVYTVLGYFQRQRLGHSMHCCFGGTVGCRTRMTDLSKKGAGIHNRTALLFDHLAGGILTSKENALEVDRHYSVYSLLFSLPHVS